jgi:hypothetical protein
MINENKKIIAKNILRLKISDFNLSVETYELLATNDIYNIKDLLSHRLSQIYSLTDGNNKIEREVIYIFQSCNFQNDWTINDLMEEEFEINQKLKKLLDIQKNYEILENTEGFNKEEIYEIYHNAGLFKEIDILNLTPRTIKKLHTLGILYLGDLISKNQYDLLSVSEITEASILILQIKLKERELYFNTELKSWPFNNSESHIIFEDNIKINNVRSLYIIFHDLISSVNTESKDYIILSYSLGINGEIKTDAAELEKLLGIPKDQIKKIKNRLIRFLKTKVEIQSISTRLTSLMENREEPLFLDTIHKEDIWFNGFEENLTFLKKIIEVFKGYQNLYFILATDNRYALSKINQNRYSQLCQSILENMKMRIKEQLPSLLYKERVEEYIKDQIERLNMQEFMESIKEKLHIRFNRDLSLICAGSEDFNTFIFILEYSELPLHIDKITEEAKKYGYTKEKPSIINILKNKDKFIVFNDDVYGVKKHLKATAD